MPPLRSRRPSGAQDGCAGCTPDTYLPHSILFHTHLTETAPHLSAHPSQCALLEMRISDVCDTRKCELGERVEPRRLTERLVRCEWRRSQGLIAHPRSPGPLPVRCLVSCAAGSVALVQAPVGEGKRHRTGCTRKQKHTPGGEPRSSKHKRDHKHTTRPDVRRLVRQTPFQPTEHRLGVAGSRHMGVCCRGWGVREERGAALRRVGCVQDASDTWHVTFPVRVAHAHECWILLLPIKVITSGPVRSLPWQLLSGTLSFHEHPTFLLDAGCRSLCLRSTHLSPQHEWHTRIW